MLRGNLSSRPFYNERLASLTIGGLAIAAVILTGFNVWRLTVLSSERAAVRARLDADVSATQRVQAEAETLRRSIDRPTLVTLAGSTKEANALIDQRTFSWTTLFGLLERTMPFDVRLVSVSPRVEKGTFTVSLNIVARDFEDVDAFVEALEGAGTFYDVAPIEQQHQEDGTYVAIVEASYIPPDMAPAPPAAAPAATVPAPAATVAAPAGGQGGAR